MEDVKSHERPFEESASKRVKQEMTYILIRIDEQSKRHSRITWAAGVLTSAQWDEVVVYHRRREQAMHAHLYDDGNKPPDEAGPMPHMDDADITYVGQQYVASGPCTIVCFSTAL